MKKLILLLSVLLALSLFTFAQKDKDKDKDKDRDQHKATATDNIQITSGPNVSMSGNTATLTWTTSGVAANDVKYGTDPNHLDRTAYEPQGTTQHTAQLTNLQAGQTVYFEILRRNSSVRDRGSFQFTGSGTTTAATTQAEFPSIGSTASSTATGGAAVNTGGVNTQLITVAPGAAAQGATQAVIQWTTSVPGDSSVLWGTDPNSLTQTANGNGMTTHHAVTITGLQPSHIYFFQAVTNASARGQIKSNISQFQMPPQ